MSKKLSRRLSRRKNKSRHRRNKSMKGGTGSRAPLGINFVPFSKSSYSFIQNVPLNNALGAASR